MSASGIVFSGLPLGVPYNAGILEHIYDRLFGEGYDDKSIASLLSRAVAASGANPDYEGTDGSGLFGFKKGEYRQNPFLSDDPMEETDRQVDYVLSNRESYQLPEFDEDYLAKAIFNDVSYQRHVRSGESDWLDTYMNKWLWPAENSIKAGHKDGKWGVYSDSAGRNIGPGLHEGTFGDVLDYSGNTSYSTEDINRIVRNDLDRRVTRIKMDLDDIGYSDLWDRLSDGGKAVLLDINYNVGVGGGSPKKWRKLVDSLATGNNERALSEMRSGDDRRMAIRQNMFNDFGGEYSEASPFAKGGKIHIKPENRGKFTALKKRTGHSASWFKAHGTPAQKKMATFALNARKWKHADGGHLFWPGGWLKNAIIDKAANKGAEYTKGLLSKDEVKTILEHPKDFSKYLNWDEDKVNEIKNKLYSNFSPWGYDLPTALASMRGDGYQEYPIGASEEEKRARDYLYAEYLGIPEEKRKYNDSGSMFEKSPYSPTIGSYNDTNYVRFASDEARNKLVDIYNSLLERKIYTPGKKEKVGKEILSHYGGDTYALIPGKSGANYAVSSRGTYEFDKDPYATALGQYTLGVGNDANRGQYVSVYDEWDLNPLSVNSTSLPGRIVNKLSSLGDLSGGFGNPVKYYDRIYLDDYYDVSSKPDVDSYYGGYIIPSVISGEK